MTGASIGIVTFNNERTIGAALASIMAHPATDYPVSVTVFDNGSTDRTQEIVSDYAQANCNLTLVQSERNLGFGGGHNRIFAGLTSEWHFICNPDIELTAGALDTLIAFLKANPRSGMACPRVIFPDGRLQPLNRLLPTVWDLFLRRFAPQVLRRLCAARMQRYDMLDIGYDHSYTVPFMSGAFIAARTDVLRKVKGFDERYFLYFEDADLSRAVQESAFETLYCPGATVIHGWQRAAHSDWRMAAIFMQSAWRYFTKWGWKLW